MSPSIQPRILKGFRDFLPDAEMERRELAARLESVFRSFGFVPIDTPVLEYAEILLGKGGGETDKQVYRFRDHGDRDVAMRFDLTVPFARFMAEHAGELYLPFKRYHIAKVWRGENTQRGRYREFTQCDFDVVGTDCASSDFETIQVIADSMTALGVEDFRIRVNHRGIFNRFLSAAGLEAGAPEILRAVDKASKAGTAELRSVLAANPGTADRVLEYIRQEADFPTALAKITEAAGGNNPDSSRLAEIFECAVAAGIDQRLVLDPSITRGLDYYTGVVFETFLDSLPQIGSVCSGGRYNELASLYTSQHLPGVGAAIGLDRLLAALETLGRSRRRPGDTKVLVFQVEDGFLPRYWSLARDLRAAGISCEVYPENRKLSQQFAYAEKKAIPFGIFLGRQESERQVLSVKNLATRESREYSSVGDAAAALAGT
ncbi:MAG TPA: histidine--tRNA ligase [Magnetospirillaceae bacterium]|nr:histidine--tRNA ligase [Magnetospirillaceae bacterium]